MVPKNTEIQKVDGLTGSTLLLDGECTLCNRVAIFLSKRLQRRKELTFIAIESEEGQRLIRSFPKNLQELDTVYFLHGPKIYSRSTAVLHCLRFMRWHYAVLFPFLWIIPLPLRDIVYRTVAKYRHRIFKRPESCTFRID